MGSTSLLWLVCIAIALFNGEVWAVRSRTRSGHHGRIASSRYDINAPRSHEALLGGAQCEVPLPPEIEAPKKNIWDHLSKRQAKEVQKWLLKQDDLNLTNGYGENKNYIYSIDLMQPNKSDVLNYLDHDGPQPVKYASALLYIGEVEPPEYRYVLVGPLPVGNGTIWQPLNYHLTRKTPIVDDYPDYNYRDYEKFIRNITESTIDIRHDLWNLTRRQYSITGATFREDDHLIFWEEYWAESTQSNFDTYDLLPLGLFYGVQYDIPTKEFSFLGWLYGNILYPTTAEFRAAYNSSSFKKYPPNKDGHWAWTDQKGPVLPLDDEAPPMPVAKTARFSVDYQEKYVQWMGWTFYISFHEDVGMTFHDVRFKGERILFELGLQEALAVYAGIDPYQSTTAYFDAQYYMGISNELMPGYDCPTYATYLNLTFTGSYATRDINAVCMFEFNADYPIQRHGYTSNTKNILFIVRTVSTVGNYDYMMTYEFYMDGSIQIVVRAAGYIQSAYYAANHDYGFHIHDGLSGSLHDHIFNFKADFDILGTANTMELVTVEAATEKYVWANKPRNTMKLVRHEIESEDESRLFWGGNGATQYRIVNKDHRNYFGNNNYGEYRGYRVLPSQGTCHLAATDSTNLLNAANFAYHDLQITQQHDTEPSSMNTLNQYNMEDPAVNFDDFFNGENLIQEDLVLWMNLGMHHVPHTGDLPNTVFTTAHTAIQITPSNYFLYDQSRDTVNMIRLDYNYNTSETEVLTFGAAPQICMANLSDVGYY